MTEREDRPYADITQTGRWTWRVTIHDGLLSYGPDGYGWIVFGRRRAGRRAHRELRKYLLGGERKGPPIRIEADGG